ncbi:MAG: ATP-binding cassette domain-containing protein [Alphaproteobacteria bacterium]
MEKNLFKFIFKYTRTQQIFVICVTAASLPFYYSSLDIPKKIVNLALTPEDPAIVGDEFPRYLSIFGIDLVALDQLPLLFGLCAMFLMLELINGSFKMYINIYKGRLGERMLRRFRYMLYARILRFPFTYFRKVSPGEVIPMITQEVEPLGGFCGDAFALPALQGGLLLTAIFYIFSQDPFMGAAAIALYPMQAYIIPKLQRRVNQLAKERVKEVRGLAERLSETVHGVHEIHAHHTVYYHLAEMAFRLGEIFDIRFEIYNRKFFIKFLNNFLAQLTPFFFFTIGGYFVVQGELSLGALVAVLAAYKDLSPPWKELLSFYQQFQDVRIKYEQVISQFEPAGMMAEEKQLAEPETVPNLSGELQALNVSLQDDDQVSIVSGVNVRFGLDQHVAVVGSAGSGKDELLLMLARLIEPTAGRINVGGNDLGLLPEAVTGRRIGFVAQGAYCFSATIRDNILYGLKHRPIAEPPAGAVDPDERKRWADEAESAGNTSYDFFADWVDYQAAGASEPAGATAVALKAAEIADLDEDIYQFGLRGYLNPVREPHAAEKIMEARGALSQRLEDPAYENLVERFDRDAYCSNATLAENLIFGNIVGQVFDIDRLAEHPYVLHVLDKVGLTDDILTKGHQLAATMIELFADLPPEHELFQRFSFIGADELPEYQALLGRVERDKLRQLKGPDRARLLSLPFKLVTARHRLALIDEAFQARVLEARRVFRDELPEELAPAVEFFADDKYSAAATVQDNILFGKIAYGVARSQDKVGALIREIVTEHGLRDVVMAAGLDAEAGIGGTRFSVAQRQKIAIARNVAKQPDVIFLSDATSALDNASQARVMQNLRQAFKGRGLVWALSRASLARGFDRVLVMKNGTVVQDGRYEEVDAEGSPFRELLQSE